MRCKIHPAFEADYCPSCGTARPVGMTTDQAAGWQADRNAAALSFADRVDMVADEIREEFGENAELRESFASDPGGWLAYVGRFDDVSHEIAAAATDAVLSGWGFDK